MSFQGHLSRISKIGPERRPDRMWNAFRFIFNRLWAQLARFGEGSNDGFLWYT